MTELKTDIDPRTIVPQLQEDGITFSELAVATKVLESISKLRSRCKKRDLDDGLRSYQNINLRGIRKAVAGVFELHKLQMYEGLSEEEYYEKRIAERSLKRQKIAERDQQRKYIAATELRKGRIEKLDKLKSEAKEEEQQRLLIQSLMIPDGHVDTEDGKEGIKLLDNAAHENNSVQLPKLRSCYVCKVRYRDLHPFYDQLCAPCATLNFQKRHFKVSMNGKVAVVTGSRVKIGYQVCLKLLRLGCKVIATTRFPNSAAEAYKKEKDFSQWNHNLSIYGLDFRDVVGLEAFTRFLKIKFGETGIDVLINNACQTIRRPTGYYQPLVEREVNLWCNADEDHKHLLKGCLEFEVTRRRLLIEQKKMEDMQKNSAISATKPRSVEIGFGLIETEVDGVDDEKVLVAKHTTSAPFEKTGLSHSAAMSQMVILPEDVGISDDILPPGMSDINGHQLDLRSRNSWLLKMDEVSTPEVMECMLINAIAPFVLNSRLKPLMTTPENGTRPDRYIINVSAMEGKFYRYKMPNHPHTNMAKAALNMLTRTSAEELALQHRIFMNSVDTGWINDENPLEKASKIAETNLFQTPIDEIDAAARILDPVLVGVDMDLNSSPSKKIWGKFLKDYKETEW